MTDRAFCQHDTLHLWNVNLQVDRVVQQVLERYGRLDGVVNCVGSVVARSALATDLEELHHTLDVSAVHGYVGCVMIRLAGKENIDGPAPQLCHPGILTATVQPLCFCLGWNGEAGQLV